MSNEIIFDKDKNSINSEAIGYPLYMKISNIEDEKELRNFIKKCEGMLRKSPEYSVWTDYVRESMGYYKCELTSELHNQTKCDIHHHPMCLFTIFKGVIFKQISEKKEFCSFDICYEVLKLHYELKIGFISLVSSLHEKFHNGYLFLPMELIKGDYKYFIDNYSKFLDDEDTDIIKGRMNINFDNCDFIKWERNKYQIAA